VLLPRAIENKVEVLASFALSDTAVWQIDIWRSRPRALLGSKLPDLVNRGAN
jgi:hypothetical protein